MDDHTKKEKMWKGHWTGIDNLVKLIVTTDGRKDNAGMCRSFWRGAAGVGHLCRSSFLQSLV